MGTSAEIILPFAWKRLLLFALGAALCVLLYLFLLNFPGLGRGGPTAGLVAVLAIAAGTWWLTTRVLRADGMSLSDLGLGAGDGLLVTPTGTSINVYSVVTPEPSSAVLFLSGVGLLAGIVGGRALSKQPDGSAPC